MADSAWYKDGVVTVITGSTEVHGEGTFFLTHARVGDLFAVTDGGPAEKFYEIVAKVEDSQIEIYPEYAGESQEDVQFVIIRNFTGAWSVPADLSRQVQDLIYKFRTALQNELKGDTGNPGTDGKTILGGNGAPSPVLGTNGDWYMNIDTWDMYRKEGNSWIVRGSLKGAQGTPGVDGTHWYFESTPPSSLGNVGDFNFNETTGNIHRRSAIGWTLVGNFKGPQGEQVIQGIQGIQGVKGDPARWITGIGEPVSAVGTNGDMYLNTSNGDVFLKASGTWTLQGNVRGPVGEQGIQGIQGMQGVKGDPARWLFGTGTPTSVTGTNGDMYLNTANGDVFHKASGVWTLNGNVRGPVGDQGPSGPSGLNFMGAWSASTQYEIKDAVKYLGNVWIAKAANINVSPPSSGNTAGNAAWDLFVEKGSDGLGSGDMLKSQYDPDDEGVVLAAKEADHATTADSATAAGTAGTVPWSGITSVPTASQTQPGLVQLATDEDVDTGTVTDKAVSPAQLAGSIPVITTASTTAAGVIYIATDTEVTTGTETGKAVTPKQLAGKVDKTTNGYAPLGTDGKVPAANLPDPPDVSGLLSKSGGTMTGALVAQSNTDYTTAQARNIVASTTDLTAGTSALASGQVYLVYE
jgi:hypothetical protein